MQLDDTAALPGGGARRGLEPTDADDDEDDEGDWKAGASVVVMNDVDDDESPAADADADAAAAADTAAAADAAAPHKLQSQLVSQPVVPLDGNHEALINDVPPSPPSATGTVEGTMGLAGVAGQQQSVSYRPGAAATASASAGAGAPPPSPLGHLVTVTLATSVGADVIRDSVWYVPQQARVPPLAAATPRGHPPPHKPPSPAAGWAREKTPLERRRLSREDASREKTPLERRCLSREDASREKMPLERRRPLVHAQGRRPRRPWLGRYCCSRAACSP